MFSHVFEFGIIDKSKPMSYVEGHPSGSGSVQGLYFKWHPELKTQGRLVNPKVYSTAFRYWSKMYPECVGDSVVWVKKNGTRKVSTLKFTEDGTFLFELNSDWMKNHNISTRQDVRKLGNVLPVLLHEEFYKQVHRLASTLDYMPTEGHEQVRICRTQLLMYCTEEELINMLLAGQQFDKEEKVMKVLNSLNDMQHALKQFAPRLKAKELRRQDREFVEAVGELSLDFKTARLSGFSAKAKVDNSK